MANLYKKRFASWVLPMKIWHILTPPLIGLAPTQNDPWWSLVISIFHVWNSLDEQKVTLDRWYLKHTYLKGPVFVLFSSSEAPFTNTD